MYQEREKGLAYSAALHLLFVILAIFGLPAFMFPRPPEEPAAITVEILPITGVTNIKPAEKPPAPEDKPDPPKEQAKPAPPVKTAAEPTPAPEKPAEKAKDKPAEKKEDVKKEEKKKKEKSEDLDAILKAVKDTAQKEKEKDKKKEVKDSGSKNKSMSNLYDPTKMLSMSEKDAIRSQIAKCWSIPAGAKDAHELVVVLELQLGEDGSVIKVGLASESKARYGGDSFFRAAADSAMRAVRQCSPLQNLPPEKFQTWRDMELTFDPKEMLF